MNEEQWKKYYARLGIKPPSPAADVVRIDEVEGVIAEGGEEKILLPSEAAETKQVEIELKEGEGDRHGQAQELRGQTKKPEAEELAKPEAEAVEGATDREGDFREIGGDEAAPDSALFLGSRAAEELEPERATLAAATILPLSLLGSKKAWVWIVVLVCLAIVGYLLIRWYSGRGESTSPPKQEPQTVEEFMGNF